MSYIITWENHPLTHTNQDHLAEEYFTLKHDKMKPYKSKLPWLSFGCTYQPSECDIFGRAALSSCGVGQTDRLK